MQDFDRIYSEYFSEVYKFVFCLCQNSALAEEVTQESFFKALKNIENFKGDCKIGTWLCKIAKNTFCNYVKQRGRQSGYPLETVISDENIEQQFEDKETVNRIHNVLHKLNESYKEVFWLRIFAELSFLQIAELFDKTESWARVTFYRAKIKIKEEMTYSCGIIRDLFPLYIDGVCSGESTQAVEEHLSQCEKCRNYYEQMKTANDFYSIKYDSSEDIKMADSLKRIKIKIAKKRAISALTAVAAVIAIFFGTISVLKSIKRDIAYDDNISVTASTPESLKPTQGGMYLSAQIAGHTVLDVTQKRVETENEGEAEVRIYFYATTTKWEDIIADKKTISYHVLTPLNEDNDVDKIFYYIGDYTVLENMNQTELSQIDEQSRLLWSK